MATVSGKGQFDVKTDASKKRIYLTFDGFFNDENSQKFAEEYEAAKKMLGQSQTTLLIDATKLKTFPQKMLEAAVFVYKDYTKFKEIYFIKPSDMSAGMQLERMLKNENILDKFKFVENFPA